MGKGEDEQGVAIPGYLQGVVGVSFIVAEKEGIR